MRELLFIVADHEAAFAIRGFFERDDFHHKLGCRRFSFVPKEDIFQDPYSGNDCHLFKRGHTRIAVARKTHQRLILVIDAQFPGSPGTNGVRERLWICLKQVGWDENNAVVLVIDPEFENWVWLASDEMAKVLGWSRFVEMAASLESNPDFALNPSKPRMPKEAFAAARKKAASGKHYHQILSEVRSVRHCVDPAFQLLHRTLLGWFPKDGA